MADVKLSKEARSALIDRLSRPYLYDTLIDDLKTALELFKPTQPKE